MIDVYEVVRRLIGRIEPIGETRTDDERFENLKEMCDLVDKLLIDIGCLHYYKNNHQFSMKRAYEYASEFILYLNKQIMDN